MDRRTRNLFVSILVVVVATTGAAALLLGGSSLIGPAATDTRPSMVGVIVAVDSEGLADVRGFSLRRDDGQVVEFAMGDLENGAQFPPGHLSEHQATAEPVRVFYLDANGSLTAIRIDDAPSGG